MNPEAYAAALPLPPDLAPEPAATDARDQTPVAAPQVQTLELKFVGRSGEYFRLWIVNLFLTVATLGVFSAWAKVRKKRYLYAHTTLDGTPFQYLGQPLPILKGRLIAAALFLLYYFTSNFFTAQFIYVIVAAALLAPWVVVGSAAFQTRYSSFRNLTFRFAGSYRSAFAPVTCYGLLLMAAVGMGLATRQQNPLAMVGALGLISLFFPLWQQRTRAYVVHHTSFGGHPGVFTARARSYYKIFLLAVVIAIGAAIVALLPGMFAATALRDVSYKWLAPAFLVPVYLGYLLAFAYMQAKQGNLNWNHTRLGPLRFESTLGTLALAKIYLTNALAILCSVGLLTPWAVMRTYAYRASCLKPVIDGDWTQFRGAPGTTVPATQAEMGEFFDLDLSL